MSKRRLALESGVQEFQIRQWERGTHVPSPANVNKLIPFIGGTLDGYFGASEDK